jgi:flagellin
MSTITGSSLVSIGIQSIEKTTKEITQAFTRLASGRRINQASDDAAGLALSASIENKLRILEKASQTTANSSAILQTADSTAERAQEITGRLAELATQAANGTYSPEQREALQNEFDGLTQELQRIGEAEGGPKLIILDNFFLDRDAGSPIAEFTNVQVGGFFYGNGLSFVKNVSLSSAESSREGLEAINNLSQDISRYRSDVIGSTQSRLDYIQEAIAQEQITGAESLARIRDVDVAETTAQLVTSQIRLQSSAKLFSLGRSMDADFIKSLLS